MLEVPNSIELFMLLSFIMTVGLLMKVLMMVLTTRTLLSIELLLMLCTGLFLLVVTLVDFSYPMLEETLDISKALFYPW